MHPWFEGSPRPRVLAHRGFVTPEAAADGVIENSFAAVALAHAAGAVYVESDCRLTADGVVVLFHDDDLSRVTGDTRAIAEVTRTELERILGDRGGLITLADALDAFPAVRFNLDVKSKDAASPVGRMVAAVGDRVLVTSFSDDRRLEALAAAEAASRGIRPATSAGSTTIARLLAAVRLRSDALARRVLKGIDAVQIPERRGALRVLSPRLIATVQRLGVEVHVWTVNDSGDMSRLFDMGVDGIVTDHADAALAMADSHDRSA